jgi:AcrR family transcriptional regulator
MSYIAERRQEEKDRRRIEIIEAAEDLYREVGWDAVTVDGVAKRARLSRALVYIYFKDKRDLHLGIALRAMETLLARFQEVSAQSGNGLEKIVGMGRAYMAYAQEFPHYFDACARLEMQAVETTTEPDAQLLPCIETGHRVHMVVVEALTLGQQDGSIRADLGDLGITSRVLWGFTHGLIQIAITKSEPLAQAGISVPQLTQQAIELMRRMLAAADH